MPARWITRRTVDGKAVSNSLRCFIEGAIVAEPGFRTVEQCIAELVAEDETVVGRSDNRPIMKDGQLIGYIEVSREFRESAL